MYAYNRHDSVARYSTCTRFTVLGAAFILVYSILVGFLEVACRFIDLFVDYFFEVLYRLFSPRSPNNNNCECDNWCIVQFVAVLFSVSRSFRRSDRLGPDRHFFSVLFLSFRHCRRDSWILRARRRRLNGAGNFRVRSSPDCRASRRCRRHHPFNRVGASVAFCIVFVGVIYSLSMEPTVSTLATNTRRRGAARRDSPRPESSNSVESEGIDATIVHYYGSESTSFMRIPRDRSDSNPTPPRLHFAKVTSPPTRLQNVRSPPAMPDPTIGALLQSMTQLQSMCSAQAAASNAETNTSAYQL